MNLQLKLLLYLDKRFILKDMKNKGNKFLEEINKESLCKFPPIQYLLCLDVMDLLDVSPELGDFLLKEPLMLKQFCTDIFFACLKSIDNEMNEYIQPSQVTTTIRLTCIPTYLINSNCRTHNSVVAYSGLLCDVTKPTNYIYHTVWSCREECENNEVILHYIPKLPPKCNVCRSSLFENTELKRCCDQVTATFLIKGELFGRKFTILDDLISKLKLGSTYIIHAVILKTSITVWSIEETFFIPVPQSALVCPNIDELYTKCDGLSWKFIYCLASSIGSNIRPVNSFMNVKINLLLSICSVKAHLVNKSAILHVLASGYDTGYVERFMMSAALLAHRFTSLGTSNSSPSTTLISASGGVCILPLPLHTYNQKLNHSILNAVETGEIPHATGIVQLKCAVWAHGKDFKKIVLRNISNVFQNMSVGDCGEFHDELAECLLQESIEPDKVMHEEQILKDVAFYLDTVAGINVVLSLKAEVLLKNYFLAARRLRPKDVTSASMKALVAVSVTIGRICRRRVADINDAIFAIWLHLSGLPEPKFTPAKLFETPADIQKLHNVITQFVEWLELFTGSKL